MHSNVALIGPTDRDGTISGIIENLSTVVIPLIYPAKQHLLRRKYRPCQGWSQRMCLAHSAAGKTVADPLLLSSAG